MHKSDLYPFVALEGIDGSGTSTQCELLVERLKKQKLQAIATQEPTDGPIGKLIRDGLSDSGPTFHNASMSLLFAADRIFHVEQTILPSIESKTVVVTDRYLASSMAYQGLWEDTKWIELINSRAAVPNLMIFLQVDTDRAAQRRLSRGGAPEIYEKTSIQEKVAAKYKDVLNELSSWTQVITVDGNQSVEQVHESIWIEMQPLLGNLK